MAPGRRSRRTDQQLGRGLGEASNVFARAAEIQAARRDGEATDLPSLVEIGAEVGLEPYSVMSAYAETAATAEIQRHPSRSSPQIISVERTVAVSAAQASALVGDRLRAAGLTVVSTFRDGSVWASPDAGTVQAVVNRSLEQAVGRLDPWSTVERCVLVAVEHEGRCVARLDAAAGATMRAETRRSALRTAAWTAAWTAAGVVSLAKGFDIGDLIPVGIAASVGGRGVKTYRRRHAEQSLLGGRVDVELTRALDAIDG